MIYLSAFDPRVRYLTGMGQAFDPRQRYLTGLGRICGRRMRFGRPRIAGLGQSTDLFSLPLPPAPDIFLGPPADTLRAPRPMPQPIVVGPQTVGPSTPNFPAFPGGLVTPMPEPPIPIFFPDTSGPIVTTYPRVTPTFPPPNLSPTARTYPATLPGGILAQPTPYALLPPSPSNLIQQAGGWLQQQAIRGIPNKYLLMGGGVLLFLLMAGGERSRRRRRNVAAGFYDEDGVFHPIRASYDYSRSRAGERKKRRR